MLIYFSFIFVIVVILAIANYTGKKGSENVYMQREIEKKLYAIGEKIPVTLTVENNKFFPVPFMIIAERITSNLSKEDYAGEVVEHYTKIRVGGYERVKRIYNLKAQKRGTFIVKDMYASFGDVFGFTSNTKTYDDYFEVLVEPKRIPLQRLYFKTNSLSGNSIIRRWIYKDPLYIKGIREYSAEDRMKDIHWKSTLKMNKLMVKDYDFTSDREIMLIVNVQCGEPYYSSIDADEIENSISIASSVAYNSIKEGIPVGIMTNAMILSLSGMCKKDVKPSLSSYKAINEICSRMDYTETMDFDKYLKTKMHDFKFNCTYVIVTPFLNETSHNLISNMMRKGHHISMIDVSKDNSVPKVNGVDKYNFREETE